MDLQKNRLHTFFRDKGGISQDKTQYYMKWLNKFLEQYTGSLETVSQDDLKAFGDNLEHDGFEEWQVKQAQEAVFLYVEKFLNKSILFTDNKTQKNGAGRHPSIKTWEDAKDIFINRMRLRHYAYNTEKPIGNGSDDLSDTPG